MNINEAIDKVRTELGDEWALTDVRTRLVAGSTYGAPTERRVDIAVIRIPGRVTITAEGTSLEEAVSMAIGDASTL